MIRIVFTEHDLTRVRIATSPDPMWEVLLSLHILQGRHGAPVFRHWRGRIRRELSRKVQPLLELAPPYGYSPDFLTPAAGADGVEPGIDALLSTPRFRLRTDLRRLADSRPASNWTRRLGDGETDSLRRLATVLHDYHKLALAPYWPQIQAAVDAERIARSRVMAESGFEVMMASLHPDIRWRPPVLEIHGFSTSRDLHLDRRGLQLIPSYFCWQSPTLLRDPALPPVLVYPVEHRLAMLRGDPTGRYERPFNQPLAALLGRTRAAVLEAIDGGCTTTELARRVGVSAATASQHATVLRDAGLISTRRLGGSVLHSLRPLGAEILTE